MILFNQTLRALWAGMSLAVLPVVAQENAAPIPKDAIEGLEKALSGTKDEASAARKRLAMKRVLRDGGELVKSHADAPNRFEVLAILFRGQQALFSMDDSAANRQAVLDTARQLVAAPNEYAALRLDADLLLSQAEAARQGGDAGVRGKALLPLVERYRDTEVEGRVLRTAMVIALELGDQLLLDKLRAVMEERFSADLEMITFQREKLGGQVFGAPVCGVFERSDGRMMRFPMDALGRTTVLYFWSKNDALDELKRFAAAWQELKSEFAGRLAVVSLNVDDLPDAGESILRGLGVEWPALKLPGGRENPHYRAYAMGDPRRISMSPTGQAVMLMAGVNRKASGTEGAEDHVRTLRSSAGREWANPRYVAQLSSLLAGDFFVVDPVAPFDPVLPPELKAASSPPLVRTAASVPATVLAAIQECFLAPPLRYRATIEELRARYQKADSLCREAIAAHSGAPDLWLVRNRRMIALLNLWKLTADLAPFDQAVAEARAAIAANPPPGAHVVPLFCLAREALRQADAKPRKVIEEFLESAGKDSGPALAAAAMLALDVADRPLHERCRAAILANHTENPLLWNMVSFMLDRYHRYWLYQVPFTAGWSFSRREDYFLSRGAPEEAARSLAAEFRTLDDKPFRIPQDTAGKWTVIAFVTPRDDPKRSPLNELTRYTGAFVASRPLKDIQIVAAVIGGEAAAIPGLLGEKPADFPVVVVPGGLSNPVVPRLGILDEDQRMNVAVLRPDGTIAAAVSGLAMGKGGRVVPQNVIEWHDEKLVSEALERGDLERAKNLIFTLAPPFDPEAVDEKGRKLKKPEVALYHLRARARVYAAMQDLDAALADAEEVVQRQMAIDGGMSLRTAELDEAEQLRDRIIAQRRGSRNSP
jgi:hypothetical protein